MGTLIDLLPDPTVLIRPGAIFLGPMEGVDHPKFYIIAGISSNRILTCSVLVNSQIHPFIKKRANLLRLQIQITPSEYNFLDHESYINCSSPMKGQLSNFNSPKFAYKGQLTDEHLELVQSNLKNSGLLTSEEINTYFK